MIYYLLLIIGVIIIHSDVFNLHHIYFFLFKTTYNFEGWANRLCVYSSSPKLPLRIVKGVFCDITWLLSMTSDSEVRTYPQAPKHAFVGGPSPPAASDSSLLAPQQWGGIVLQGLQGPGVGSGRPRENLRITSFLCAIIQTCPYTTAACATFSSQLPVSRESILETGLARDKGFFQKGSASGRRGRRRLWEERAAWWVARGKPAHILSFPANLLVLIPSRLPLGMHGELLEAKEMNLGSAIYQLCNFEHVTYLLVSNL